MKIRPTKTHRTGLALGCGLLAFAFTADAKKPVKPPPPPPEPPAVTFTVLDAGWIGDADDAVSPAAINDSGAIVGTFATREFWANDPHYGPIYSWGSDAAFLLEPVDGVYFQDADGDGANDLVQFLPGSAEGSTARDINSLGQIIGSQVIEETRVATVWNGGEVALEMPGAEFADINDAGAIVGTFWQVQDGEVQSTTFFIIVPDDGDLNGRPDTWFADADGDGCNDLLHVVQEAWIGNEPAGVFDDLSVLCRDFVYPPEPEDPDEEWNLQGNQALSVVRPDFTDADGDGNPWYADVDGDCLNDLIENFPVNGSVASVTGAGLAAGSLRYSATNYDATLFDANTLSCLDLDWVDPDAKPSGSRASAGAVNDAAWIIGSATDGKGNVTPVFWRDGVVSDFRDIASGLFTPELRLVDINQAGVIAGLYGGGPGLFVAVPSVSP